jgi:PhzF family phenazine biosynthesis protein
MGLPLFHVDAFADRPFTGNPAAVCLLERPAEEAWMRQVAAEMNLSETAFVCPGADAYSLRWFTPTVEVALCGHATLASAHVLWETGRLRPEQPARFTTLSGLLTVTQTETGIDMDFPAKPIEPAAAPPELARALGVPLQEVGKNGMDYLVRVESEAVLRGLKPDLHLLAQLPVRGVIVTSRATTPGFDFVSRFFAPASGVNEDPVTGSAHTALGPFWRTRLGKDEFRAYQASARGGVVGVRVCGERVVLSGRAVTVLRGELLR